MALKTCNYANCIEDVGDNGFTLTLKRPDFDGNKVAAFCCIGHGVASLSRLADDRGENVHLIPRIWKVT